MKVDQGQGGRKDISSTSPANTASFLSALLMVQYLPHFSPHHPVPSSCLSLPLPNLPVSEDMDSPLMHGPSLVQLSVEARICKMTCNNDSQKGPTLMEKHKALLWFDHNFPSSKWYELAALSCSISFSTAQLQWWCPQLRNSQFSHSFLTCIMHSFPAVK